MSISPDLAFLNAPTHNAALGTIRRKLGERAKGVVDLCVPVNPYFPTPEMMASLKDRLEDILKFYPERNEAIAKELSPLVGIPPECLVLVNGSTEAITWVDRLFVKGSLATDVPTFGRWTDQPRETGKRLETFLRRPETDFHLNVDAFVLFARSRAVRAVALCNPNNPTGALINLYEARELVQRLSHLDLVILDESFLDFSEADEIPTFAREATRHDNVVVIKSLGKNFGLHGVRFGFAAANPRLAAALRRALPPWNVNAIAETVIRMLPDFLAEYTISRRQVIEDRDYLIARLRTVPGLTVFPSKANFAFVRVPEAVDGLSLRDRLLSRHGLFVRECGNKEGSSSQYFRIAATPRHRTDRLVEALKHELTSGVTPAGSST